VCVIYRADLSFVARLGGYELAMDIDDFQSIPGSFNRCSHYLHYSDKQLTETPSTVCTTDGHGLPYSTGQLHDHISTMSTTKTSKEINETFLICIATSCLITKKILSVHISYSKSETLLLFL